MRRDFLSVLLVLAALAGCPGSGAGIGDPCGGNDDCGGSTQCLNGRCVPHCERAPECGDGYACVEGACVAARLGKGDLCKTEVDCVAGMTCQINGAEVDADNRLVSSCQPENPTGRSTGAACDVDEDCRNGACDLGHCVDVCKDPVDCPAGTTCMTIPRVAASGQFYSGCLQSSGILSWQIPVASPSSQILLPVPSDAKAAELVMSVDDPSQKVGAEGVLDPCGCTRYTVPCEFLASSDPSCTPLVANDQYYSQAPGNDTDGGNATGSDGGNCTANPVCEDHPGPVVNHIRHLPAFGRSVLLMPSIPRQGELKPGAYRVQVSSFWPDNSHGSALPHVTAVVRIGEGSVLDLHFFFLDLTDHPCVALPGNTALNAASAAAATGPFRTDYLGAMQTAFGHAGVKVVDASYDDIVNRHPLDGLDVADIGALFTQGRYATGINVFFVRSLSPIGTEVFGPNPGPAGLARTAESGIVISTDTLCYRDWPAMAQLTLHALARYMGLYHNVEPRDPSQPPDALRWADLVPDSDSSPSNLLYPSARGGLDLSNLQHNALIWSPVLE
jgi:hypothetical protein